jgi:hypothetical protein
MQKRILWGAVAFTLALGCDSTPTEQDQACARLDSAWKAPPPKGSCPKRPTLRDLSTESKLSVAVYHFNIQYVAGGVRGFPDGEIVPRYDLSEAETEDRIVTEGLEPVLNLYLAHPSFRADIELQAYMVEVIALRHPKVLAKMVQLAQNGQVDFDSFHYSDQLYVAYPKRDLEVSLDLTESVFSNACLPLGLSIFTQEGQFAPGQLKIAKDRGYTTSLLPKNLFTHQYGEEATAEGVLFEDPNVPGHAILIGGRSYRYENMGSDAFELRWTFMDDGEIAFSVDELNPYFGLDYVLDPELIAKHAKELEALEQSGFVFATVAEAVAAMKKRGVPAQPLPPVLDGTWQPNDTQNVFRWMGGSGAFRTQENDSEVLAALWRARTRITQAEKAMPDRLQSLIPAWREALLGQVSDSTGWNPFANEIKYSFDHSAAAEALVEDAYACAGLKEAKDASFQCEKGSELNLADLGATLVDVPSTRFVAKAYECTNAKNVSVIEISGAQTSTEQLTVFDDSTEAAQERDLGIGFTRTSSTHRWVMALEDDFRTIDTSTMKFAWTGVPLPYGIISTSERGFVIQENASGRTAVLFTNEGEHTDKLRFYDKTVSRRSEILRRWYVLQNVSDARALQWARDINQP